MTDIAERLRSVTRTEGDTYSSAEVIGMVGQAADEIDQLRRCLLQARCPVDGRGFVDACIEDGLCGCTNGLVISKELLMTPALRKS